jgi:integrase
MAHDRKRKNTQKSTYGSGSIYPNKTTLHDLRRFLATTLEDLDVGQRTIGHILGHVAGNVTENYIKRHLPTMRRALERLEHVVWQLGDIEPRNIEGG